MHACSGCAKELAAAAFSSKQLAKGAGKQRCRACIDTAEAAEGGAVDGRREKELADAAAALRIAEASGDTIAVLKASSLLSALEAEAVTGMRPKVIGRGRGGSSGGRGRLPGRTGGRG
ncbi:hypothetical protein FOA52_012620 [Chlamydomonas sp. UWO 241]|nr:hypothetical protein FOA52_012620 [Chlamydomonas sp. UWO 241]